MITCPNSNTGSKRFERLNVDQIGRDGTVFRLDFGRQSGCSSGREWGGALSQEVAQKAIKKAMTSSPKFNTTYDEIPIFLIQQMRIQKQAEESEGEAQMLVPMYFSLQNMVQVWQQFTAQSEETKGMEPAINLMDLFELVGKMQEESEIDFRNVLLVPTVPTERGDIAGAAMPAPQQPTGAGDEQFKMPGATLGDI